jgi:hypothetical protein
VTLRSSAIYDIYLFFLVVDLSSGSVLVVVSYYGGKGIPR